MVPLEKNTCKAETIRTLVKRDILSWNSVDITQKFAYKLEMSIISIVGLDKIRSAG